MAMAFSPTLWFWALVVTVVGAAGGALVGKYKNAVFRDTIVGAALGPVGWIVSAFLPKEKPRRRCAACGKSIDADATACPHCGAS